MPINENVIEQRFSELFSVIRELDKRTALSNSEIGHLTSVIGDLKEDFMDHDDAEMRKFDKVEKKFEQIDDTLKRFEKIIWTALGALLAMQMGLPDTLIKIIGG